MPSLFAHTKSRFHEIRIRLENHVPSNRLNGILWELFLFVFKQAWACLFGGLLLALVLLTKWILPPHPWLARYDLLFLAALAIQALLLLLRMETVREAKVILMFHVVGTLMELFKTHVGSWNYPGTNLFRIGQVPLFSGFMYSSVGSYLARISRILDLRYTRYPKTQWTAGLAFLIYANFFTHHYIPDIRVLLYVLVAAIFGPTWVHFRPYRSDRWMPLIVGFGLVALFIWIAENIATFATVWVYPGQRNGWHVVAAEKFGAWFLLMIISFILVSFAHRPQPPEKAPEEADFASPSAPCDTQI